MHTRMHTVGNVYLRMDPCNGLGEGWLFALDYEDSSTLIEEVIPVHTLLFH
jgi:hypothetical protein